MRGRLMGSLSGVHVLEVCYLIVSLSLQLLVQCRPSTRVHRSRHRVVEDRISCSDITSVKDLVKTLDHAKHE